jgi:hypothetical protein
MISWLFCGFCGFCGTAAGALSALGVALQFQLQIVLHTLGMIQDRDTHRIWAKLSVWLTSHLTAYFVVAQAAAVWVIVRGSSHSSADSHVGFRPSANVLLMAIGVSLSMLLLVLWVVIPPMKHSACADENALLEEGPLFVAHGIALTPEVRSAVVAMPLATHIDSN